MSRVFPRRIRLVTEDWVDNVPFIENQKYGSLNSASHVPAYIIPAPKYRIKTNSGNIIYKKPLKNTAFKRRCRNQVDAIRWGMDCNYFSHARTTVGFTLQGEKKFLSVNFVYGTIFIEGRVFCSLMVKKDIAKTLIEEIDTLETVERDIEEENFKLVIDYDLFNLPGYKNFYKRLVSNYIEPNFLNWGLEVSYVRNLEDKIFATDIQLEDFFISTYEMNEFLDIFVRDTVKNISNE